VKAVANSKTQAFVVVKELEKLKPDYSLECQFREVPKVGDYISIHRPDLQTAGRRPYCVRSVAGR